WSTNPDKADARSMEQERQKLRTKMDEYKQMSTEKRKQLKSEHKASDFKIGDTVHVISMDSTGTITSLADSKGYLKVQMGILNSSLPASDLVIIETPKSRNNAAQLNNKRGMGKALNIQPDINVLGMTVAEATMVIDRYLDDAMLAHLHKVTIIHGKGTGALRKGIHEYLKKQSYVKSFRMGEYGEGEAGVTVVEL
ncbi:MAG: Smr/MutS family protein, partial [Coprococcus sp.]